MKKKTHAPEKKVEELQKLRDSEKNLKTILTSMADLLFVLDKEGIFVDYTQAPDAPELYNPPE